MPARLKIRGTWIEIGNVTDYRTICDCISDVENQLAVLDSIDQIYYDFSEPPNIVLSARDQWKNPGESNGYPPVERIFGFTDRSPYAMVMLVDTWQIRLPTSH